MKKTILSGLGASIVFYIFCGVFSGTIGRIMFFAGDPFTMSFHIYTYIGLIILCGIIVTCTVFLNTKINDLKGEPYNKKTDK